MGALTLKSFPFELRGWDIEKFESIDPTDGFGSNTRVYVNKDQIVQIEPDYNVNTFNTWLTDKGRQFFDSIFGNWSSDKKNSSVTLEKKSWLTIIKSITQTIYVFEHCNAQKSKKYFFTLVFENLSLEILSLLMVVSQNYSFISLRRAENFKTNNDLESSFQLNLASDKAKLSNSTLCLILATNPRYEGYYLNLNLRQRFFKGNFKCLTIGSILDLTFPVSFLGSNLNSLKNLIEGNHLICQDIKFSRNPLIIYNNELLKRNDGKNVTEMLKSLNYLNVFNKSFNNLNMLTPTLSETGSHTIAQFSPLSLKDLIFSSSLYFLNVNLNNIPNLKRITEIKLLNYSFNNTSELATKKLFLDQNYNLNNNATIFDKTFLIENNQYNKYLYLPSSMFYENEETFINTEGLIKRTTKLIFRKKTKNNWQILRKIFKQFRTNITFLNDKDNQIVFFNSKTITNFKNFIHFHYLATQSLTNLNFYLNIKTKPFVINPVSYRFAPKRNKILNTKLKYWLDDFFSDSKDEYSQNSLIMTNCSKILRSESTNFF